MAGNDPKNVRDNRESFDADEDPLVELARIVSEDGGFSGRVRPRPSAQPVAHEDLSADLEAELLQELETSFAGREAAPSATEPSAAAPAAAPPAPPQPEPDFAPEPAPPPPPPLPVEPEPPAAVEELRPSLAEPVSELPPLKDAAAAAMPPEEAAAPLYPAEAAAEPEPVAAPAPPDAGDPDDLLRSIEEQLSQFDQRARAEGFGAGDGQPLVQQEESWSGVPEPEPEPRVAIEPEPRAAAVPVSPAAPELEPRGAVEPDPIAPAEPAPEPVAEWSEDQEHAEAEYRFRGPAGGGWDSLEEAQPTAPVQPPPAAPPVDAPPQEPVAAAEEPVAPPPLRLRLPPDFPDADATDGPAAEAARTSELASLEEELSAEFDPRGGRTTAAPAPQPVADVAEAAPADDAPDMAHVAAAAAIAPQHAMRAPPEPAPPPPRRSRKVLVTAASVLIVVAIGGAGAMYLRTFNGTSSGPPPVIAAQDGPVKITPEETQAEGGGETVGEAVYDRVAGQAPETEETVVEGAEEPREIARIVLPEAESAAPEQPPAPAENTIVAEEPAGSAEEAQASLEDFGPRRVETFVVRPDGTIVTTTEAGEPSEPDLTAQQMATAQTEAMDPKPVETVTISEPRTAGEPTAAQELAAVAAEAPVEQPTEAAQPTEEAAAPPATEPVEEVEVAVAPEPETAPEPEPAATPPTAASGFVVQIASQTSQEAAEATFASLQRSYGSVLGGLEPNIQRADLGEKGIYYRVRVGPWAERADAVNVCEALQAAGGDCFVAR